ncbi:MAG: hypothetical protein K2K48_01135 [Anaeroplasmataceae bacterium]|nr:hypothetical protein [Anaeroplasmataceae bacterium]MDE6413994.1 hypothetical protein [Anaeroplasmataceae bacterium]
MKKKYSRYVNPKSKRLNKIPVTIGSVIVAYLSDYERLPKYADDHKRESIVMLKDINNELGVVYIHGLKSIDGKTKVKKKESGLWEEIEKNGQKVYVDLDIKITDAEGKPIKQGVKFQNTGIILNSKEMKKVEKHLFENKGREKHSIRNIIKINRDIQAKKKSKV